MNCFYGSIMALLAGSLLSLSALAQEKAAPGMTLHDCMEYAVSNSTKMRLQAADRSDEQLQRRYAILKAFTPSLSASTSASTSFGRNLDPETNTYKTVTSFGNGYSVSAGITLFSGFQIVNNLKMTTTAVKMGISTGQQERDGICLATMEAFANVIYYTEMLKVVTEQVETAEKALVRAGRQVELGQKSYADVLQMESELARNNYLLISTSNERNNAIITLKDVMFWPSDEEIVLSYDYSSFSRRGIVAEDLEEKAKAFLPAARIASYTLDNAGLGLKIARGAYSPRLSLNGGWSTSYYTYPGRAGYTPVPFSDQFRNNSGEYVSLSLSIPLYDQFGRRTELNKKKNALARAEAQYDQTMRDIENEVRRAVSDCNGAEAAFRQAEQLAEVQQEAFQLSAKQFENGLISAIEYQTASQNYLNAMAERMNSLLQLSIKDAVVRYYNGEAYIDQ